MIEPTTAVPSIRERRKTMMLLGEEVEVDPYLGLRVKYSEIGAAGFGMLGLIFYIIYGAVYNWEGGAIYVCYTCEFFCVISFVFLYYKNMSGKIFKRLLCEVNVLVILGSGLTNWAIDTFAPVGDQFVSSLWGFLYFVFLFVYIFTDAVKIKHRPLVVSFGVIFVGLTLFNIYGYVFGTSSCGVVVKLENQTDNDVFICPGIILADYGNGYVFYRRTFKRSVFLQIFIFSLNSLLVVSADKKLNWMMFGTSNVPRAGKLEDMLADSQTAMLDHADIITRRRKTNEVLNPLNILTKQTKSEVGDEEDNKTTKKTEIESTVTQSTRALDKMDEETEKRIARAEIGLALAGCLGAFFFALHTVVFNRESLFLEILVWLSAGCVPVFYFMFAYKNISTAVFCRLLRELNVIIIFMFAVFNWIIETFDGFGESGISWRGFYNGFLYFICMITFIFLDSIKKKSRYMMLIIGLVGVLFLNMVNISNRVFFDTDLGIILLKYQIFNREFYFYKRSIQRSIFSQILCFSANGVYNLIKDKDMKLLMFGTGYINRETGEPALKIG